MKFPRVFLLFSFFFMSLIAIIFFRQYIYSNVDKVLKTIPQQEQQVLSDLFQELIENNCFGYTLFGNKPVSFEFYYAKPSSSVLDFLQDKSAFFANKGEKVWAKYKDTLKLKNFILKFQIEEDIGVLYLINQTSFLSAVNAHLDLFQEILGIHTTAEGLLNRIAKDGMSLDVLLNNNIVLKGILLGYGKHNAFLSQRSTEIWEAMKTPMLPPWQEKNDRGEEYLSLEKKVSLHMNRRQYNQVTNNYNSHITPGEGFNSLSEEHEWIHAKFENGAYLFPTRRLCQFSFPGFCADGENEETQKIISDYICTKKKLSEIYSSGDFLEITLKRLTGEL